MIDENRDMAWALVTEYIQSDALRRHCLSVECAMRAYAERFGESPDAWGVVGLIHDFDYEIHPTLDQHPQEGVPILRERGYSEQTIRAVLSHADHLDVSRDSPMEKCLYAVDELTGFITAVALVRPSKSVAEVTPKSVKKKMKDKAFARAVDREALLHGAELIGVEFDEHVAFVIEAMESNAETLGLAGTAPAGT